MKVKYSLFLGVVVLCACLGLSCVSAADTANDTQVVCDTSSLNALVNKTNDVEIDTNLSYNPSNIFINESHHNGGKLVLPNIKANSITIKNNYYTIDLRNVTCDVLIIEDSKPYYIDIYDSNIKQVIFRNVDTWSLADVSSDIQNSSIDSLIINKSSIDFSLKIISSNIGNMRLDNSYIKYLLFKYSNVSIQNVVESTIKSIEAYLHSNLIIEDGQNSSYHLRRDKTSRVNAIGPLRPVDDDSGRRTRYHMVGTGVWVPTFIQVDFHQYINCAEETCKPNGSTVHMSACVKTYAFLFIYSDPIGHGTLSLLKDGEVIDVKNLSENSNPTFTFKIEKGHTYTLKYEGTCFQESSWYYRHYEDSSKTLMIQYTEDIED